MTVRELLERHAIGAHRAGRLVSVVRKLKAAVNLDEERLRSVDLDWDEQQDLAEIFDLIYSLRDEAIRP